MNSMYDLLYKQQTGVSGHGEDVFTDQFFQYSWLGEIARSFFHMNVGSVFALFKVEISQ